MKNIIKLSIVTLSFLLLTGCTPKNEGGISTRNESGQQENDKKAMTIKDLISSGIAQKCTWSLDKEGTKMEGDMIIKGDKFRQTAKISGEDGKQMEFNYISDGEYLYNWSDDPMMNGMAFKMKIEESQSQDDSDTPQDQSFEWDKEYDFNCKPTVVSDNEFKPPQGIEFMDMNDFSNSLQDSIPNYGN